LIFEESAFDQDRTQNNDKLVDDNMFGGDVVGSRLCVH
jgi:hypothetical protein